MPLFSCDDVYKIYQLNNNSHINNLLTFTAEVVTSQGTWAIKITDINTFNTFCENNLNTLAKRTTINDNLQGWYYVLNNSERGFWENFKDAGIDLFKKDASGGFKLRTKDTNNTMINTDCN